MGAAPVPDDGGPLTAPPQPSLILAGPSSLGARCSAGTGRLLPRLPSPCASAYVRSALGLPACAGPCLARRRLQDGPADRPALPTTATLHTLTSQTSPRPVPQVRLRLPRGVHTHLLRRHPVQQLVRRGLLRLQPGLGGGVQTGAVPCERPLGHELSEQWRPAAAARSDSVSRVHMHTAVLNPAELSCPRSLCRAPHAPPNPPAALDSPGAFRLIFFRCVFNLQHQSTPRGAEATGRALQTRAGSGRPSRRPAGSSWPQPRRAASTAAATPRRGARAPPTAIAAGALQSPPAAAARPELRPGAAAAACRSPGQQQSGMQRLGGSRAQTARCARCPRSRWWPQAPWAACSHQEVPGAPTP